MELLQTWPTVPLVIILLVASWIIVLMGDAWSHPANETPLWPPTALSLLFAVVTVVSGYLLVAAASALCSLFFNPPQCHLVVAILLPVALFFAGYFYKYKWYTSSPSFH